MQKQKVKNRGNFSFPLRSRSAEIIHLYSKSIFMFFIVVIFLFMICDNINQPLGISFCCWNSREIPRYRRRVFPSTESGISNDFHAQLSTSHFIHRTWNTFAPSQVVCFLWFFLSSTTVSIILWFRKLKCWLSIQIDLNCWLQLFFSPLRGISIVI
jgi:hypothetical protein